MSGDFLLRWLYVLALALWLGTLVFFSFVVAPGLFRTFPVEDAGRAVGAIFPAYYAIGYVCGTVLVVLGLVLARTVPARRAAGLAAVMLAATLYAGVVVQPRAAVLRPQLHAPEAAAEVRTEFDRLHRLAVGLNVAVLLGALALSGLTVRVLRSPS